MAADPVGSDASCRPERELSIPFANHRGKPVDIRFDCTQCGRCCHDLKIPLSVDEARRWAGNGYQVQILTEASPAFETPPPGSIERHRHDRAVPAMSGTVPIRVSILFVAAFEGPCPHLRADMLCGDYEARPRVCRIYPAEVSPRIAFDPSHKACPPEAWLSGPALLSPDGAVVDPALSSLIAGHRSADLADVDTKRRVCGALGIRSAAFANEGFALFSPSPDRLLRILTNTGETPPETQPGQWNLLTNRQTTLAMLDTVEAEAMMTRHGETYIGFFDDEIAVPD